jgi:hypothetical protein
MHILARHSGQGEEPSDASAPDAVENAGGIGPLAYDGYIRTDELDSDEESRYREYATDRRGHAGRSVFPADELSGGDAC